MILQPVVENCFKHGFDPAGGLIRIRIGGYLDEESAVLTVEDDGVGITAERMGEINAALHPSNGSDLLTDDSIGLANVTARMRLYGGAGAGIELEPVSADGLRGLRVSLRIPHRKASQSLAANRPAGNGGEEESNT
jgi:two-component system sensor histidine kinase YesM